MNAAFDSFSMAHAVHASRGGPYGSVDRVRAWDHFAQAGLPHSKTEAWRYTPSSALWARRYLPARMGGFTSARTLLSPLPRAMRLVFINGRLESRLSTTTPRSGVWVRAASSQPWPAPKVDVTSPLVELNRALFEEAAAIEIAGQVDAGVIEVLHVMQDPEDGAMTHPRVQLHLERGSRLTLVETYLSQGGDAYLINAATEVQLDEGAQLRHLVVQDAGTNAAHLGALQVRQERDSRLDAQLFQFGATVGRREVSVQLAGEGAHAELGGLFLTGEGQHHDQHVWIDHAAPRCTSRQDFRGVARGRGRGVFTGHVRVQPHAQKTDAAQRARALLLSREAEVDLKPHLEIHADDVKATHGASVGELDAEQLFYLRVRGIPEDEARQLLLQAFTAQTLDAVTVPGLRERLEERMGRCG